MGVLYDAEVGVGGVIRDLLRFLLTKLLHGIAEVLHRLEESWMSRVGPVHVQDLPVGCSHLLNETGDQN